MKETFEEVIREAVRKEADAAAFYRMASERVKSGISTIFEEMAAEGVKLIITVDCGISGHEACEAAKELDVTVIVSDHHEILGDLPDAFAVINPHREGCGF